MQTAIALIVCGACLLRYDARDAEADALNGCDLVGLLVVAPVALAQSVARATTGRPTIRRHLGRPRADHLLPASSSVFASLLQGRLEKRKHARYDAQKAREQSAELARRLVVRRSPERAAERRWVGRAAPDMIRADGVEAAIEVRELRKTYGEHARRFAVSTSASRGARSSGCSGRTAPARRRPSRSSRATGSARPGRVSVLGFDPSERPRELRARVGIVLQSSGIYAHVTVARAARPLRRLLPAPARRSTR